MKEFLASLFPAQTLTEGAREGLPYWILWFLLCIIFLLVTFIFLRDKDLRRKLDSFFFGIKKKLTRTRLQTMMKRERKKQEDFLRELGRKTWEEEIILESDQDINRNLDELEKTEAGHKEEIGDIENKVSALRKDLGEVSLKLGTRKQELESEITSLTKEVADLKEKEKEIEIRVTQYHTEFETAVKNLNLAKENLYEKEKDLELPEKEKAAQKNGAEMGIDEWEKKRAEIDQDIQNLIEEKTELEKQVTQKENEIEECKRQSKQVEEDKKDEIRKFQKEIKEWEKTRDKIHDKIKHIEKQMSPLFLSLGKLMNEARIENKDLVILYSKIDRTSTRQKEIEKQILDLK